MIREFRAGTVGEMHALAARMASHLRPGVVVFLRGDLGTGKTTFVAGILLALGHKGAVKSPTFTLVEPYAFSSFPIYHFDLYRLNDPDELEFLGLRDYVKGDAVCLFEWPERGAGRLPAPDVEILIKRINEVRHLQIESRTPAGDDILGAINTAPG